MKHQPPFLAPALLACATILSIDAAAQRAKHWVGGSGAWHDATHWANTAGGNGGAGAPRANENAVIAGSDAFSLVIDADAVCASLIADGSHGELLLEGANDAELRVHGDLRVSGEVDWRFGGTVRLVQEEGAAALDAQGVTLRSDVVLDGGAEWELRSALVIADHRALVLREGSLKLFDGVMSLDAFRTEGRARKHVDAGGSITLVRSFEANGERCTFEQGASVLMVNGGPERWDGGELDVDAFLRGITNCGTGVGQIPFQVNAFVTTNYNGFGVSCNGVCNGAVNVTITGGTGNFNIQWVSGPNGSGTSLPWPNICSGNKLVIVTDVGQNVGCFASAQVLPPPPLGVIFFGLNPPTCADVCNGTAITFPGGGAGFGYVYDWNNGAESSSNPTQLCAGVNTLELTDANNCVFDTTFTIDLDTLLATLQITASTCFGDCNGAASVSVTGGTPGYDYLWEPGTPAGDGTDAVTGLCAGDYTLQVLDVNGCDTLIAFTLIEPPPIVPAPTQTNASCAGICDGTASVNPGPGFNFDWGPGVVTGDGTPNATGLCAGVYTVLITDQVNGCDTAVTFTISEPPAIDVQLSTTPVTCSGDCDGTATISISGGVPDFVITWGPGTINGQGTPNAIDLCPGTYTVNVADASGCDTTLQVLIVGPQPILPNESFTNVTCFGACNGTAGVAPTGGTGSLDYDWTPDPIVGEGTPNVAVLCAGPWCVTISDSLGCDTTVCMLITEPPQLLVTPSQTNISCGNACDATATVTASGGSPPYTYDWSGNPTGEGTPTASGLCAGVYTVTVTDSIGCFLIQTFVIDPPTPISVLLTVQDASCANFCDGTASAVVSGGTPGYTYNWSQAVTGQGTPNATGLCPQNYTLTVTDTLGCDTTIAFTITAPPPIDPQAAVLAPTCAGDCNGSIVLNTVGGTGNFTYTWTPVPPNNQGFPQALNLCAGTWSVLISDGICDTTLVFDLVAPPAIIPGLMTTPVTCNGACNGTATSTASGGTPGLTYAWSPAPGAGQGTPNASQMCPGPYTLTITDILGCDTVIAFTITEPPPITGAVVTTLASCGGVCDGSATLTFSGGTGPISIVWTPTPGVGQGTTSADSLCAGPASVTLTDSLGCDTTIQFAINTPSGIVAVPTITDASCADVCDGTIVLNVSGGSPGYVFSWNPVPPIGGGASVGGLCPGQWIVQITDQAGCDTVLVLDVGGPTPVLPNGTFTHETCNGPCDATASAAPSGGAGGYSFAWSPQPPIDDGNGNVAGLCAGDWCVTITDAAGCDTVWCFTVLIEQPIVPDLTVIDASCFGLCDGAASVTATGGSGNYSYLWVPQPPIGQGTDSVSGLCLGQWSVTISDPNGCDTTVSFIVNKPSPITTSLAIGAANCGGACTGQAAAFPSGGNGGFTFLWQPDPVIGQGTFFADSLCTGIPYTLTITDSLGCDTTENFLIPPFTPLQPNLGTTPVTCSGDCDGTATVGPTGGEGPYTYDWSPGTITGDGTTSVSDLCAGVYDLVITDVDGCDTTINVLITSPQPITAAPAVTPIACNGDCNGTITLNALGGTGNLGYTWTPQPPVGQGTASVSQLCAGTWSVLITDDNGCDTTMSFILTEPPVLTVQAEVTPSLCQSCVGEITLHASGGGGGYFFAWGPPINVTGPDSVQSGLCAGIYTVIIGDTLGCVTQISVPVSDSNGEVLSTTDDNVTCPTDCDGQVSVSFNCSVPTCTIAWYDALGTDLNQSGNTLSNLCAGLYLVEVINGDGCTSIDSAQVIAPAPMVAQFGTTPVSCAGVCDGTAGFGITGGVPSYTIVWDPPPPTGQGTPNVTGLCAGPYDVTITDASGCSITTGVLIPGPQPIDANAVVQDISCSGLCDGSITLNTQGGTGAYSYVWNPVPPGGGGDTASQLCAGTYAVTIIDANGCDTTVSFVINEPAPLVLTPAATPAHCQVCDGTASVQIAGGTGSVTVTWTDQNGVGVGSGPLLAGLCAGIYTATAQDANGCSAQAVAVVTDATGETLTLIDGQTTCANTCDGAVSVSFSCTVGPCEIEWFDANGQSLAQNLFTLPDLCIGDYYVAVVNGAGCTVIDTASVLPSQTIVPNLSTTPATCAGGCDGTATVGPVGGVPPYTYDWEPGPIAGDGSSSVTGLCAGVYTVLIADSTGCDTTINVLITEPVAIAALVQTTSAACADSCDGSITVLASGGSGTLSYTWSPPPPNGQGTNAVSGLCAGDWTVVIGDSLGCDTALTITITEPLPLALTTTSTQSTCGICSGSTTASASGGTASYNYVWTSNGSLFGTNDVLPNICAGFYQVLVTDANGCQAQQTVPVTDSDGEVVDVTNDIVTCPGICDGEVSATFNCSIPGCAIAWFDAQANDLNEPSNTLSDLCAGIYYVQVVNGNGCLTIDTAIVADPPPINPNLGTTPVTCAGDCDGTATVGPTGGVAPYTYEWSPDPITGDSTASVSGLCAGTYTVTITDSLGCPTVVDVLILTPQPITASATITPVTCNGDCDGSIVVDVQGGTGQPTFLWIPDPLTGQFTNAALDLCPQDWTLEITDASGCDTSITWTLIDPAPLDAPIAVIDNLCFGDCTGEANASISGGTGPYITTWSIVGGGVIAIGVTGVIDLCAGSYVLDVVDSLGCSISVPFDVGEGTPIAAQLSFTGETCNGPCDGVASVSPTGGAGGYAITWMDALGGTIATGTPTVNGLCVGNYSVSIVDALGCDSTFTFTILPYTPISDNAVLTPLLCNGACDGSIVLSPTGGIGGYTYDWSPVPPNGNSAASALNICAGIWTVTIADSVGCDTVLSFDVTEPAAIVIAVDSVADASCNSASDGLINTTISGGTPGLTISWTGPNSFTSSSEDLSGLVPGPYVVTVTDANDCVVQLTVTVGALSTVSANAGADLSQCHGGQVILSGAASQGATAYSWTDDQGNVVGTQVLLDLAVLAPGSYSYILTASAGPCSDDDTVFVDILPLPLADAGPDQTIFLDGSVTLGGQPTGPAGSTFLWSPDSLVSSASAANPTSSPPLTTWFTVTVTSPSGCASLDSVLITVIPDVQFPTGFTPNGDGSNDVWQIDYIDQFPDCTVEIYNRWGELLFSSVGYQEPWDGTYSGGLVPVGTYYYAIELHDERFPDPYTGPLTVIR